MNKITESSLSRIWKHVTEHDSGTISAYRSRKDCGDGDRYTKAENQQRNGILKSKLLALGYGVTEIQGVYVENYGTPKATPVKEQSFMVVDLKDTGNLKSVLLKLGEHFEQDSITYSKSNGDYFIISTNECASGYPGRGKLGVTVKLGKPFFGKDGEFHSLIHGRPFVFESTTPLLSTLSSYYPTEIRSILENAKLVDLGT